MPITVGSTTLTFNDSSTLDTGIATPTAGDFARGGIIRPSGSTILGPTGENAITGGWPSITGGDYAISAMSQNTGWRSSWAPGTSYARTSPGKQYYHILKAGTFRTSIVGAPHWAQDYSGTVYAQTWFRLYKNGVATGTERTVNNTRNYTLWQEDLVFAVGDKIELYVRTAGASQQVFVHTLQLTVGAVNQLDSFILISNGV